MAYTAGYSPGHEFAAAVCAADVLRIGGAVERQVSVASPGCSRGADVGLSSVDVGGDNIRARIRPQNRALHVENGRYTELGSIDRLGRAVGTHTSSSLQSLDVGGLNIVPLVAFYPTSRPMSSIGPSYTTPLLCARSNPAFPSLSLPSWPSSSPLWLGHRHARIACPTAITADCRGVNVVNGSMVHVGEKAKHKLSGTLDAAR
ncbi:hypothetical protein ARMSODRAFT_975959 [Armillaria solidipes]|uniref:Uncharacterized protein n=1 Tax=Armillaria solidipes TaxID=1076256 RepID=A0A2H3BI01_9AGAR|nr:hypothetical protein ARMSODRAFT_975959 [Armillaria solidipes]